MILMSNSSCILVLVLIIIIMLILVSAIVFIFGSDNQCSFSLPGTHAIENENSAPVAHAGKELVESAPQWDNPDVKEDALVSTSGSSASGSAASGSAAS